MNFDAKLRDAEVLLNAQLPKTTQETMSSVSNAHTATWLQPFEDGEPWRGPPETGLLQKVTRWGRQFRVM
ncbi:MAG TPA: hypothetical protein VLT86_17275 [Vicinamibacterales bacterium]|nr:hypothetical protein [Vicinamibacterales bacterium]